LAYAIENVILMLLLFYGPPNRIACDFCVLVGHSAHRSDLLARTSRSTHTFATPNLTVHIQDLAPVLPNYRAVRTIDDFIAEKDIIIHEKPEDPMPDQGTSTDLTKELHSAAGFTSFLFRSF